MAPEPSESISIHQDMEVVDNVCEATHGCADQGLYDPVVMVLLSGILAVIVIAALIHLRNARSVVDRERERASAEREAFAEFARRVDTLEASSEQPVTNGGSITTISSTTHEEELDHIEEAYRKTVMDIPHYEEDYDESIFVNMAAELGEDITSAVLAENRLTPQLKQGLLARANEARDRRSMLIDDLDREADLLADIDGEFQEIDSTIDDLEESSFSRKDFEELIGEWEQLQSLESKLTDRLDKRQHQLQETRATIRRPDQQQLFHTYLYGSLSSTYPILSTATEFLDRVRSLQSNVLQAITSSG